jgi:hypothetical protein
MVRARADAIRLASPKSLAAPPQNSLRARARRARAPVGGAVINGAASAAHNKSTNLKACALASGRN